MYCTKRALSVFAASEVTMKSEPQTSAEADTKHPVKIIGGPEAVQGEYMRHQEIEQDENRVDVLFHWRDEEEKFKLPKHMGHVYQKTRTRSADAEKPRRPTTDTEKGEVFLYFDLNNDRWKIESIGKAGKKALPGDRMTRTTYYESVDESYHERLPKDEACVPWNEEHEMVAECWNWVGCEETSCGKDSPIESQSLSVKQDIIRSLKFKGVHGSPHSLCTTGFVV